MRRSRSLALPLGQFLQAGVNYLFLLTAVRVLSPEIFAAVSLLWIWYAAVITGQRTILGEQVIVNAARDQHFNPIDVMLPGGLTSGLLFMLAGAAAVLAAPGAWPVLWVVLSVGFLLVVNDAIRFAAMASGSLSRLLGADLVGLTGMLCGFVAAIATHSPAALGVAWLSVPLSMAIMRGYAVIDFRELGRYVRSLGAYVHWAGLQVLIANVATQATVVLALPFIGRLNFAGIRGIQTALSPISTPAGAIQPLLFRSFGQKTVSKNELVKFLRWGGLAVAFSVTLGLALTLLAPFWVPPLLGPEYLRYKTLVLPVTMTLGMVYVGLPTTTWLRVLRRGPELVRAQAASLGAGALFVPAGAAALGVQGVAWALLAQATFSVAIALAQLWRIL